MGIEISTSTSPGNTKVADDGRNYVEKELSKRGANVRTVVDKRKTYLQVSGQDQAHVIQIRVKTKRGKGNWHSKTSEGRAVEKLPENESSFWVFVNLNDYNSPPQFWIVPDSWMRNDIHTAHEQYLAKHGGRRAENDQSDHHSIDEKRLAQWEGRWDILKIFS